MWARIFARNIGYLHFLKNIEQTIDFITSSTPDKYTGADAFLNIMVGAELVGLD